MGKVDELMCYVAVRCEIAGFGLLLQQLYASTEKENKLQSLAELRSRSRGLG